MGQITIYLDDETEARMRASAEAIHLSNSKWIAQVIQEKLADEWPPEIKNLAGAWADFPSLEEIRADQPADSHRETL